MAGKKRDKLAAKELRSFKYFKIVDRLLKELKQYKSDAVEAL